MPLFLSQRLSNPKTPPYYQRTYSVYKYKYNIKYIQVQVYLFVMAENSELYDLLVRVKNGYDPGWAYYSRYDDNLDDIRFNEKNPGLSSVNIVFSDYDDYLKLYSDLLDEDDIYYLKLFLSNQYQNDFDRYQLQEEWEQGYVASYLNDENKELIDRIAYFISKDSVRMDFTNKSKLLYKEYEGEIDNIMWEWSDIEHNCRMDIIQDEIIDEFSNKFYNLGIKEVVPLYKYKCSVNTLIRLFDMFGLQSGTIFDLFKKILEVNQVSVGSYYNEMYWNTNCTNFDMESFNRSANWNLTRIYEHILDDEKFVDVEEFYDIKNAVDKEFGFDKWNKIKTKENLYFKVDDVDPATNKIIISFRNNESDDREEKRSMTYDELKRMETQYELFNEIKKLRKKIFLN